MEDREEYYTRNDDKNKVIASMITITITNKNKVRLHEIFREMLRLEALDKYDAEELMAFAEAL